LPGVFLLVVLQTTARRSGIPIDSLAFEYGVVSVEEREINSAPKEGVYVKGLFLEGAQTIAEVPRKVEQGL
jgi:dynein heavy chain